MSSLGRLTWLQDEAQEDEADYTPSEIVFRRGVREQRELQALRVFIDGVLLPIAWVLIAHLKFIFIPQDNQEEQNNFATLKTRVDKFAQSIGKRGMSPPARCYDEPLRRSARWRRAHGVARIDREDILA